ncbi:MAG: hypothetical protein C5B54_06830 [Acidobacteria bacterium]|nr:MAG: hypothetical protein C5B54_06830 [Acidobacteriota bacterium]
MRTTRISFVFFSGVLFLFTIATSAFGQISCDIEDTYGNTVNYISGSSMSGSNEPSNNLYWLHFFDSAGISTLKFTVKFNSGGYFQREIQKLAFKAPVSGTWTPFAWPAGVTETYGPATMIAKTNLNHSCKYPFIATYSAKEAVLGNGPVPIPDDDVTGINSTITVAGVGTITHLTVTIWISHPFDSDLVISLKGPDATVAVLSFENGTGSANYGTTSFQRTIFDDSGNASIDTASAPFTGMFQPDDALSVFNGKDGNGTWTLHVVDSSLGDVGTLNAWSLIISDK